MVGTEQANGYSSNLNGGERGTLSARKKKGVIRLK